MGQLPESYHRSEAAEVRECHLVLCRRPCLRVLASCVSRRAGPGALRINTFIMCGEIKGNGTKKQTETEKRFTAKEICRKKSHPDYSIATSLFEVPAAKDEESCQEDHQQDDAHGPVYSTD